MIPVIVERSSNSDDVVEKERTEQNICGEEGQIKSFVGLRLILIFVNIRKDSLGGVYDLRRAYEQSPLK